MVLDSRVRSTFNNIGLTHGLPVIRTLHFLPISWAHMTLADRSFILQVYTCTWNLCHNFTSLPDEQAALVEWLKLLGC